MSASKGAVLLGRDGKGHLEWRAEEAGRFEPEPLAANPLGCHVVEYVLVHGALEPKLQRIVARDLDAHVEQIEDRRLLLKRHVGPSTVRNVGELPELAQPCALRGRVGSDVGGLRVRPRPRPAGSCPKAPSSASRDG
jgi:hypothetical protein